MFLGLLIRFRRAVALPVSLFFGALLFSLSTASAYGQDNAQSGVGSYAGAQEYQLSGQSAVESVNAANGNLVLDIPLLSYPQKGKIPPIIIGITYSNVFWSLDPPPPPSTPNGAQLFEFAGGGAQVYVSPFVQEQLLVKQFRDATQPGGYDYYDAEVVQDPSGAQHLLSATAPGVSVDQTGYRLIRDQALPSGQFLTALLGKNGFGYRGYSSQQEPAISQISSEGFSDAIGNNIAFTRDTTGDTGVPLSATDPLIGMRITSYTDSIGRLLPMPYNYELAANQAAQGGCQTLQYPGPPSSPTIPLTFCYSQSSIHNPYSYPNATEPKLFTALSSVTLPNGTQWTFQYDQYGELKSLTYPTGATATYGFQPCDGGCSFANRPIDSRTVTNGQRSDTWQYAYTSVEAPNATTVHATTTETDPLGNQIVHTYNQSDPNLAGEEQSTQYIDLKAGLLETLSYHYSYQSGSQLCQTPAYYSDVCNLVRDQTITTLSNGNTKKVSMNYDGAGDVMDEYDYDWGQGAPGALIRQTHTKYEAALNANYAAANLLTLPASICVPLPGSNSCSPSNSDTASYTAYGYDENNGSPGGVFGNQTSTTTWTGSGLSLQTSTVFNSNAMPIRITDSAAHTTTIAYDAPVLFPSSVTAPPTSGTTHITNYVYDDPSGVLISSTDENGATTSYTYDSMKRVKTITRPTGESSSSPTGTATYNYTDASAAQPLPYYTYTATLNPSQALGRTVNLDGLGRTLHDTLTSDPDGPDVTDTSYDALGRVSTVSNPHRSASSPTDGTTTYSYDALGRTTGITLPDGNTQSWQYTGNVTLMTNEAGSQWQQTTDSLGRLTQVMEPDAVTGKPAYETDYGYDVLGNLTYSDQWGGPHGNAGDRVRTFTYDGLSRLLTATLPEPGTTTYRYLAYPANTSLCSGSASNVCSRTDARGVVTAYSYDELGRITGTSYPNAGSVTPSSTFNYDAPKGGWSFSNQTFPSGQPVAQNNLKGRLSWEQNANATIVYGYDTAGRTTLKSVCTVVNCAANDHYDMHLAYDNLGNVTFSDLGQDAVKNEATPNAGYYYGGLTMAYSAAGTLQSGTADIVDATHPATIVSMSQYNPLGSPGLTSFGGMLNVSKTYSSRGWLSDQTATLYDSRFQRQL